jgi:hypothetical protein
MRLAGWTAAALCAALFAAAPAAAAEPVPAPDEDGPVAVGAFIPGAAAHPSLISDYAREVGRRPAIVAYYRTWAEHPFDNRTLTRIARRGAVPFVTWEPWQRPLREIAAGRFDDYLRAEARAAARWRRAVIVRFAHEMNGDWYPWSEGVNGNTASDYVSAWQHIVRIFRQEKARNVRWMWAPNADKQLGNPPSRRLYPGDDYVDWVALSGFCWGGRWDWEGGYSIFHFSYRQLLRISKRPIAIAETGASEVGGDKAKWIRDLFARDLERMPRIRAVVWFGGRKGWANWNVKSSPRALAAFRQAIAAPRYAARASDLVGTTLKKPPWGQLPGAAPASAGR